MKTITFVALKGGSGKTLTSASTAFLLSQRYRVLGIDMDYQGNFSEVLLNENIYAKEQYGRTTFDAVINEDVRPYIRKAPGAGLENLHLILANDQVSWVEKELYKKYGLNDDDIRPKLALRRAIKKAEDDYDFCIIDTPPRLGEATLGPLLAADGVVVMFEGSRFSYSSLPKTLELVQTAKRLNKRLKLLGILPANVDLRRYESREFLDMIREEFPQLMERLFPDLMPPEMYPHVVFENIIRHKATTGRLSLYGFDNNRELQNGIESYGPYISELLYRLTDQYLEYRERILKQPPHRRMNDGRKKA